MSRIVVVAPHPDDEVIGCGGSLVKHARAGHAITVITISRRVRSRVEEDITDADYRIESESAHRILGVRRHVALDLPGRSPSATEVTAKLVTEFRINPPRDSVRPARQRIGCRSSSDEYRRVGSAMDGAIAVLQRARAGNQPPTARPRIRNLDASFAWPLNPATTLDDFSSECKREAGARRTPVHAPRGWI